MIQKMIDHALVSIFIEKKVEHIFRGNDRSLLVTRQSLPKLSKHDFKNSWQCLPADKPKTG
jgi:hypothetical protein